MNARRTRRPVTRLASVTYDVYVRLRDAPGNGRYRMAYHDGVLEIMSPEYLHDRGSRHLYEVVMAYGEEFDVPCQPAGTTTFRKGLPGGLKGSGKEADESFYIGAVVDTVLDKNSLDLTVDPSPSLWIEVENWGNARAKLPLYAALGVTEVWRYRPRKRRLWFGRLNAARDGYDEAAVSVVLPGLTPALVLDATQDAASTAATAWRRALRTVWFPAHRDEISGRA